MAYFKYFPKLSYDLRGVENQEQYDFVTNILARILVKCHGWKDVDGSSHEALIATCEFEKYIIMDGDRPDTLAHQFYGDSELHWIILYANGAAFQNPYYDWPLSYFDLQKFVDKKYDDRNAVHHYEDDDGNEVDAQDNQSCIDHTLCTPSSIALPITNYIHEEILNDAKRTIRIIQPRYVNLVVDEFKRLMTTQ